MKIAEIKPVYDAFVKQAEPKFLDFFRGRIHELNKFFSAYEKHLLKISSPETGKESLIELVEKNKAFKEKIQEMLSLKQKSLEENGFDDLFRDFYSAVEEATDKLDDAIIKTEHYERYTIKKDDRFIMVVLKSLINTGLAVRLQLRKFANIFRRWFKKPPLELRNSRNRNIPFKNMARFFLMAKFVEGAMLQVTGLFRSESQKILQLWQFDDEIDIAFQKTLADKLETDRLALHGTVTHEDFFKQLRNETTDLLENAKLEVRKITENVFESFDNAFGIVNTVELSSHEFSQKKLNARRNRINKAASTKMARWRNTYHTLFDDWAVDVEITSLYYSVYDRFNHLNGKIDDFIAEKLDPGFIEIRTFITQSTERIKHAPSAVKKMAEVISIERDKVNNELVDKTLTQIIEKLTNCFTADFNNLSKDTLILVHKVSDKRGFVKSKNYEREIRDSEIDYISPRELLSFEALPNFSNKIQSVRDHVEGHLERVRLALLSLGTVCDFNLESALMLMDKEKRSGKHAEEVVVQGFERALAHLDSVIAIIHEIQSENIKELRDAVSNFNRDIQVLKNTENIFDLNVKIARIKAVERSKRIRTQTIQYIRELVPRIISRIRMLVQSGSDYFKLVKEKMGFTLESKTITFELSEFIQETQTSLKKLPFVYQRLYQLQPTDEERFFVNREAELKLLRQSYENWNKDRFITVAVIGEKGSGVTSLINYFLRSIEPEIEVYKYNLSEKRSDPEEFFNLFSSLFQLQDIKSNQQLIDSLNETPGTRIVVLENLQHMFLKKVHGFECMKLLFELMANTSKKIMWIGAYTPYSWKYLDKTIHLSNYFTDEIFLEKLNDETITEIIFKRNRLSGYQIFFTADEETAQSKTFKKLSDAGKQRYLQKQFFTNLNKLANGNISLAQMYWLRSTLTVDERSIRIAPFRILDFYFIKNLSGEKLFALQVLLHHDGLTLSDFSTVMNQPESVSRNLLIPMLEMGLLIRPRKKFNINPMIYKHVSAYLSSRNFIH
jgi:hypothetical protein